MAKTHDQLMKEAEAILREVQAAIPQDQQSTQMRMARIRWNNRLRKAAGRAFVGNGPKSGTIELSSDIFKRPENQKDFRNTVLHEIAHLLAPGDHHGPNWKQMAHRIGCTGERCHEMTTAPTRTRGRYPCKCVRCGTKMELGPVQAVKVLKGAAYTHRQCGGGQVVLDTELMTPQQTAKLAGSKVPRKPRRRRGFDPLGDILGRDFLNR